MTDKPVTEIQLHQELSKCRSGVKDEIKDWLDAHEKMEFDKHDHIDESLKALTRSVHALTEAFAQGKGAVTVMKWLALLATGAWAMLVWAKDHLRI